MITRIITIIGHTILTLGNRTNFLPLSEPNSTDNLGEVQVSQQIDAEKGDEVNNNSNNKFNFFYMLNQQPNLTLQDQHEGTKIQASKTKPMQLTIREYDKSK
jgi:hypothetical protein